ncbi:hypothetical protein jhhlp_001375 [Lomentospora prolificans]|uniref:DNA-(apurinic or apyrimidinic site) endonuclease 2 n=1 Tax=Lomentospora prolificans TaxID=41688 RepID=A0A2N3NHZ1_9PEZI|nr:hypothetical protein jhhlp_001375 [Lomentospora prolificans]
MPLRITSWNVNGIRNPFSYQPWNQTRSFQAMFDILEADIVVLQETKIQRKDLRDDMVLVPGWDVHFSLPKHKKGYSGVVIYTRTSKCCPIRAEEGVMGVLTRPNSTTRYRDLPPSEQIGGYPQPSQLSNVVDDITLDSEGRCVLLEFPAFVLIGVYSPANRDESRDDFRIGFLEALDARVRNLIAAGKQVILTGDMNVISAEKDTSNLAERLRKEGLTTEDFFSSPSRRLFNHLLYEGRIFGPRDEDKEPVLWDLCRLFHKDRDGMFTCWDTKKNTRPANFGSRIDYVLCSNGIKDWFTDANIQEGLMGSDHCPVFAVASDTVAQNGTQTHILDLMNPAGMYHGGKRLREWTTKDLLPLSARLIPEFDRRQSIKDMFMKKPQPIQAIPAVSPVSESDGSASDTSKEVVNGTDDSAAEIPPPPKPLEYQSSQKPSSQASVAFVDSPAKRSAASPTKSATREAKRSKPTQTQMPTLPKATSRQRTLKAFFQPKSTPGNSKLPSTTPDAAGCDVDDTSNCSPDPTPQPHNFVVASPSKTKLGGVDGKGDSDKVFDPIENKESWSNLLGKRTLPKCEHGENCITLVTKKAGVNYGRSFFICPRPLGPSGEKEKGTEWRCGTFIWSSDWKESRA